MWYIIIILVCMMIIKYIIGLNCNLSKCNKKLNNEIKTTKMGEYLKIASINDHSVYHSKNSILDYYFKLQQYIHKKNANAVIPLAFIFGTNNIHKEIIE